MHSVNTTKLREAEVKLRQMQEHIKEQTKTKLSAQWSKDLRSKDEHAMVRREREELLVDRELSIDIGKAHRKEKIVALFREEELQQAEELAGMGLAFKSDLI